MDVLELRSERVHISVWAWVHQQVASGTLLQYANLLYSQQTFSNGLIVAVLLFDLVCEQEVNLLPAS